MTRHGAFLLALTGGVWVTACATDPAASSSTRNGTGNSNSPSTGAPSSSTNQGSSAKGGGTAGSGTTTGSSGSTSTGSGNGGSTSTSTSSVDCSQQPLPSNTDDIISTFEDGMGDVMQVAGRGGGFYMFNDGTGKQTPPPGALPPATKTMRCADSAYALCMSGSGFTMWGAGTGTDLGMTTTAADGGMTKMSYDASMYKGIAFWAKANGTPVPVRVSIKDKNTAPEGGVCDAKMTSGAMACNDDWGKSFTLTTDWKPYTMAFSDMKQSGWGAAFSAFNQKAAYSIQFQVSQGLDFDLCIDDLVFTR